MAAGLNPRNPGSDAPPSLDPGGIPASPAAWRRHRLFPLAVLLSVAMLIRIVGLFAITLIPEEAYYWMYAQHPNLSYYDHPPMVAWVIDAGTMIFGHNEWGVRIVGHLMMLGATALLYEFGRIWFGRRAAFIAALSMHVLPVYYGIGLIATMDSALLFFWMIGLVGVSVALKRQRAWGWYVAGLGLGGALLSKYTGIFIAGGTGLAVLIHRPWRRYVLSIHPYLGLLLGFAMFTPVVVWNAQHDWASFRFQFLNRWEEDDSGMKNVLGYVGGQFAVATPIVLAGLAVLLARLVRRRRWLRARWLIGLCFGLPTLLVMFQKSFQHEIHINWTAPVYVSFMPAMAQLLLVDLRRRRQLHQRPRWTESIVWTAVLCTLINIGLIAFLLLVGPHRQPMVAFGPWKQLAAVVDQKADQLQAETGQEPLIVAEGKYRLASVIAFYRLPLETDSRTPDTTTSEWYINGSDGLGYPFWKLPDRWAHAPVIFIAEHKYLPKARRVFDDVQVVYDSGKSYPKRYEIAVCRGHHAPTTREPASN